MIMKVKPIKSSGVACLYDGNPKALRSVKSSSTRVTAFCPATKTIVLAAISSDVNKPREPANCNPPLYSANPPFKRPAVAHLKALHYKALL